MVEQNPMEAFQDACEQAISSYPSDKEWNTLSLDWLKRAFEQKYMYNFSILGRPVIQTPMEIVAMQELIWSVKPDLIIETGIAHGGSLILSASMLELNAACGYNTDAEVLGIDIDIRAHNREAIESHPMYKRISMIEGSSDDPEIIGQVKRKAESRNKVMVCLDSNHTYEHVLNELNAYATLTSIGSYCIVFDTIIEDLPDNMFPNRPWSKGNNPKIAVWQYLESHPEFEIDRGIENKLLITVAPDGYLKRVK